MLYVAAPMLPVSARGPGGAAVDPPPDVHAATKRSIATKATRLIDVSDVGPRLPAVNRDARTVYEARVLRADECHDAGHLFDGPEPAQGHVVVDEVRDAIWIGLLLAIPPASRPQDGARRHCVDRDAFCGDIARQRCHEAVLRGLGRVVGRRAT